MPLFWHVVNKNAACCYVLNLIEAPVKQNNSNSLKTCTIHLKLRVKNKPRGGIFLPQLSCVARNFCTLSLSYFFCLFSSLVMSLEPNIRQDTPPQPRPVWWSCMSIIIVRCSAEGPYFWYLTQHYYLLLFNHDSEMIIQVKIQVHF